MGVQKTRFSDIFVVFLSDFTKILFNFAVNLKLYDYNRRNAD